MSDYSKYAVEKLHYEEQMALDELHDMFEQFECIKDYAMLDYDEDGNRTIAMEIVDDKEYVLIGDFKNTKTVDIKERSRAYKNFTVKTGKESNITVLHIDIKEMKDISGLDALENIGYDLDDLENLEDGCVKIKTPNGGFHYVFPYCADLATKKNIFGLSGVDILNDGEHIFSGYGYKLITTGYNIIHRRYKDAVYLLNEFVDEIENKCNDATSDSSTDLFSINNVVKDVVDGLIGKVEIKVHREENPLKTTKSKVEFFNSLGCVLGNVDIKWTKQEDGKFRKGKRGTPDAPNFLCAWSKLDKSLKITGNNFFIRTGKDFGITLFDLDVKPEEGINARKSLKEIGVDFDTLKCIKVKTGSGGWHYITRYDPRFKQNTDCFGIKGFDIRSDGGCAFGGLHYKIFRGNEVKSLNQLAGPEHLTDIYNTLVHHKLSLENKDASALSSSSTSSSTSAATNTSPSERVCDENADINIEYYDLLKLLPREYFNTHADWVKPIYALQNEPTISLGAAKATARKLLEDFSDNFDEPEFNRVFGLQGTYISKRFTMGSVVNIIKKINNDAYEAWKAKYRVKKESTYEKKERKKNTKPTYSLKDREVPKFINRFSRDDPLTFTEFLTYIDDTIFDSLEDAMNYIADNINRVVAYIVSQNAVLCKSYATASDNSKYFVRGFTDKWHQNTYVTYMHEDIEMKEPLAMIVNQNRKILHKFDKLNEGFEYDDDNGREFYTTSEYAATLLESYDEKKIEGILYLIREVICNNDEKLYNWFLNWLAFTCQFKNDKTGKVPILIATEGCGKGSLTDFLSRHIYGIPISGVQMALKHIVGTTFNEHILGKKFFYVNEASTTTEAFMANFDELKKFITDEDIQIRGLYKTGVSRKQYGELMIISNHRNVVPINDQSRRYVAIPVSDKHVKDGASFFGPWRQQNMNQEVGDHFYTFLMQRETSRTLIEDLPITDLQREIIEVNRPSVVLFWEDLLADEIDLKKNDYSDERYNLRELLIWKDYKEFAITKDSYIVTITRAWEAYQVYCKANGFRVCKNSKMFKIQTEQDAKLEVCITKYSRTSILIPCDKVPIDPPNPQ